MRASQAVLPAEVISKKGARLTCTVSCQGRWGRGEGVGSDGVDGSAAHSCQLHVAWHSALCHKRGPVSTTAVYIHAKSIFKDKSISVHLRTH